MVRRLRFVLGLLGALACPLAGCAASTPNAMPAASSDTTQPSSANTAAHDDDPTLDPDEYKALGMATIQDPWTAHAYQQASVVLTALAKEHPEKLPRIASDHSGRVFRRLVARENLDVYAKQDIDWNIRSTSLRTIQERLMTMALLYIASFETKQPLVREVMEILILSGHCDELQWKTLDEAAPGYYRQDNGYPARMALLQEMQRRTSKAVDVMFVLLTSPEVLPPADLKWYASALVPLLPSLLGRLTTTQQARIQQAIATFIAEKHTPAVTQELQRIEQAALHPLEAALPRPTKASEAAP